MRVYVVRENYYGDVIAVFTDENIIKELMLGYDVNIEEFEVDEVIPNWVPRFAQYKKERDCSEEPPPPTLEELHGKITYLLERLINSYNREEDFAARKHSRQIITLLDKGKGLGYNMEPIELVIDQRLKDNYQTALSEQDFSLQLKKHKLNYQYETKKNE
jgi:hypothetical protein